MYPLGFRHMGTTKYNNKDCLTLHNTIPWNGTVSGSQIYDVIKIKQLKKNFTQKDALP